MKKYRFPRPRAALLLTIAMTLLSPGMAFAAVAAASNASAATAAANTVTTTVTATVAAASCDRPARLHFSFTPQTQLQDTAVLRPLFKELSDVLHIPVDSVSLPSYGAVMEGLLSGSVDIAKLGPASYTSVRKDDDSITPFATLSVLQDSFGASATSYYSLLIVRQKSGLTIETLRGKKLALVDPDSTSGALIPLNIFSRQINMPLASYFSRIGYSGTHEQSVMSVADREVDAAFVASSSLSELMRSGRVKPNDMRVLWKSDAIPRDPFVYRGRLCADIRQKIQKVFFASANPNVAATLNALHSEKFVPVSDSDYQIIRDLQQLD
jgi:phosphonate transport system substrate-binding protein